MMNQFKFIVLFLATFSLVPQLQASQEEIAKTSPVDKCSFFYSHDFLINQWTLGLNPAGELFNLAGNTSKVQAALGQSNQNIHRAMDPGKALSMGVTTQSYQTLGKVKVQGLFGYQQQKYDDLLYNGNMDFRYMNLYMLGDTIGGKQQQEGYFFNAQVAYPLFNHKLFAGIRMDYEASVGAKIRDLRNKNTIVRARFTPGLIYNHGNLSIGASGGFSTETNFTDVSSYMDERHTLFYHMGMGHYSASINFSGSETIRYESDGLHAGLQVQLRKNQWTMFQSLDYATLNTEARIGNSYRLINGITDYSRFTYRGSFLLEKPGAFHHLKLNATAASTNATEVRQEGHQTFVDGLWVTIIRNLRWIENKHIITDYSGGLEYQYINKGSKRPFDYQITAAAQANLYDATHYPSQNYGFYNASGLTANLEYQHFVQWKRVNFDPVIGAGARFILESQAVFKPYPNYIAQIPELDYRFFSENFYRANAGLNMSTSRFSILNVSQLFLNVNGSYFLFPNVDLQNNHNILMQVSMGAIF